MLSYIFPDNLDHYINSDEIALNNMKVADKCMDFTLFIAASRAWMKNDKTRTYQTLESATREHCFNTYVFPRPVKKMPKDFELKRQYGDSDDNSDCLYELIFSVKPDNGGMNEILQIWNSYEESYDKLKDAGQFVAKCENPSIEKTIDNDDNYVFDPTESGIIDAIAKNKIFLILQKGI